MFCIILFESFASIEKSILSQQKHQLSSHFHSQSFTMHCTYEMSSNYSAVQAHFNAARMKVKWAVLTMIFALKVLRLSNCQASWSSSDVFSLNSMFSSILNSDSQREKSSFLFENRSNIKIFALIQLLRTLHIKHQSHTFLICCARIVKQIESISTLQK